jgi:hypothetical protein
MGKRLHGESLFSNMDYNEESVAKLGHVAATDENFFFHTIVELPTDVPVGMLIGMLQTTFFGTDKIATDLLFFIEPEHRGQCAEAIQEITTRYSRWGFYKGAKRVYLVSSTGIEPERTEHAYEACGFRKIGTVHEA